MKSDVLEPSLYGSPIALERTAVDVEDAIEV